MRKLFIDCGTREGDAIAAFLGDRNVGSGDYFRCLRPRIDASDFELIGFESSDYEFLSKTRARFSGKQFTLIEKLVWVYDGFAEFDTDGRSDTCRLVEVARTLDGGMLHNNPSAKIKSLPCIGFARYITTSFSVSDYLVVKMDIEGAEYDVLDQLIATDGIYLINELYVEYHHLGKTHLRPQIENHLMSRQNIYYRSDWP